MSRSGYHDARRRWEAREAVAVRGVRPAAKGAVLAMPERPVDRSPGAGMRELRANSIAHQHAAAAEERKAA